MKRPAPFHPGETLCCVVPLVKTLKHGGLYTVADCPRLGRDSFLIELAEIPDQLFHPKRFVKVLVRDDYKEAPDPVETGLRPDSGRALRHGRRGGDGSL